MAEVTLMNKSKSQTFTATYYHSVVGKYATERLYSVRRARSKSGKHVAVKEPHSFSIIPGKSASVNEAALRLPQVKAALKSGWLVKCEQKAAATPVAAAALSASKSESKPKAKSSKDSGR